MLQFISREDLQILTRSLIIAVLLSLAPPPGYSQDKTPETAPGQNLESPAEGSPYVLPPGDPRETARLNDVCRGLFNSYECAQAVERSQLPHYPREVVRQDGSLRLHLRTGKTVTFKDSPEVAYSFRDYLAGLGYFLLHFQLLEGDGYLVVNDRTGRKYPIHDLPLFSPDRRRLATLSMDLEAGFNPNALQIWRLTIRSMTLEWSLKPKEWGPSEGIWLDNQTLKVVQKIPQGEYRDSYRQRTILIKKTAAGWKLQPQAATGR